MKAGQFTYYICRDIDWIEPNYNDICYLPGVIYGKVRNNPYRFILQPY
jgi:hypothetical protein